MADNHEGTREMADHSHPHAAHVPGTMDIRQQERTFAGFLRLADALSQ